VEDLSSPIRISKSRKTPEPKDSKSFASRPKPNSKTLKAQPPDHPDGERRDRTKTPEVRLSPPKSRVISHEAGAQREEKEQTPASPLAQATRHHAESKAAHPIPTPAALQDGAPKPTDHFFLTEDFLDLYENINDIMKVDYANFLAAFDQWAIDTDHSAQEWIDFFNSKVLAKHNSHLGQTTWQPDQGPVLQILELLRTYIKKNPNQPFPGWMNIEDLSHSAPTEMKKGHEKTSIPERPAASLIPPLTKKRTRNEDLVAGSQSTVIEEANVKRLRVERTVPTDTSSTLVEEIIEEETYKEVSESIEPNMGDSHEDKNKHFDLTRIPSTPDSDSDEEEGVATVKYRLLIPPDSDEEISDEEEIPTAGESLETQAILNAETQAIDEDLPEPEGGFATSDEEEDLLEPEGGFTVSDEEDPDERNDQDLINEQLRLDLSRLNKESIELDVDVPEPEGGFASSDHERLQREDSYESDDIIHENMDEDHIPELLDPVGGFTQPQDSNEETLFVSAPSSLNPDSDSDASAQEIHTFSDLANPLLAKGYTLDLIIEAIHLTSANKTLLEPVLMDLKRGNVPYDVKGVWTEKDDADLQGADARAIARVEKKHGVKGPEGWKVRVKFLKMEEASQ
jgi:hypothetical protein